MKIGLIDVDGHNFPNLALMKLSALHKKQGDIEECYNRINYWKQPRFNTKVKPFAQPELDFSTKKQNIPQWQKDLAHWCNKKTCYFATDFKDFSPRNNFKCSQHFK